MVVLSFLCVINVRSYDVVSFFFILMSRRSLSICVETFLIRFILALLYSLGNSEGLLGLGFRSSYLDLTTRYNFIAEIRETHGLKIQGPVSSGLGLKNCLYTSLGLSLDHQQFPSFSLGIETETDFCLIVFYCM